MSKHDRQFFNVFSAVLGILIAFTVALFVFSRILSGDVAGSQLETDPLLQKDVVERIRPFGQVAVAGRDNAALAIAPPPGAAEAQPAAVALPSSGEEVYNTVCAACHGAGIAGAPKIGDKAAWAPRIAQGEATLRKHALEGFTGSGGVMPAKGGRVDMPDDSIILALDHLVAASR